MINKIGMITKLLTAVTVVTWSGAPLPQYCKIWNSISNLFSIMNFIFYNFVQSKDNFVHLHKHEKPRFNIVRSAVTLPQHCQYQIILKSKFNFGSIMNLILYNFVQSKKKCVYLHKHEKTLFYLVGAAVLLPQHCQYKIIIKSKFNLCSIMYFILYNFVQPKKKFCSPFIKILNWFYANIKVIRLH